MSWFNILDEWVGIDAERWRRLNNYFRQNIDEVISTLRFFEAGESYTTGGVTTYDVDIQVLNLAASANIQVLQWESVYLPQGLISVTYTIQCFCTVSSANAFWRVTLTEASTGTTYQVDIPNLPAGAPTWRVGVLTVSGNEGYYSLRVDAYNNTGSVQSFLAREMLLTP